MLPHDLAGLIAFDPLGSAVPGDDPTRRVEHEDCVVLRILDQQPEALFTLSQDLLGLLASREVAGHLAEPTQAPAGLIQGGNDYIGPKARPLFADPPAFILNPSVGCRHLQFPRRLACRYILGWIKA